MRLPSQCAVCRSWPSQRLCQACLSRFASPRPRCARCALVLTVGAGQSGCPQCQGQSWPLDACFAAVDYAYPWSDLLTRFKFQKQTGYADLFAQLLLRDLAVGPCLAALNPEDWLLPLPLSPQRLAERGFNQAWELAQALHLQSRSPAALHARLLLRLRHTEAQSRLPRQDRLANVRGAFLVDPLMARQVQGRQVVLIDDVMTSGASLASAAQALRQAGAASVRAIVVARTPA